MADLTEVETQALLDELSRRVGVPEGGISDAQAIAWVGVVSKLYMLAVVDEVHTLIGRFAADLTQVKHKYNRELSAGRDQFKMLTAAAERWSNNTDGGDAP